MATLQRVEVVWDGLAGLPGVSVHYGVFGGSLVSDLKTFFTSISALFPAGLTWQVPNSGDTITDTSGIITGAWTDVNGGTVSSAGSGIWAQGTGCMVRWDTATIVGHRRLKGRTFLCPLFGSAFQSDGTILNAYVTTMQTAADAVVTAGNMLIWHRPPKGTFAGGASGAVVGATVPDKVTSLRSRRH